MSDLPSFNHIESFRLSITLQVDRRRHTVFARLRPFPSRGRPDISPRVFSLSVPPPPAYEPRKWTWALGLAARRFNTVDVPDDFYDVPGTLRYPMLIQAVYDLADLYANHPDRR